MSEILTKQIKDVSNNDPPFKLQFEVMKKLNDDEDGLICQISDETGTAKFLFRSDIKKFIQEGNVYIATNVVPLLKDNKITLELVHKTGSLTKEPFILPFKDHTFDLSAKVWPNKEMEAKEA